MRPLLAELSIFKHQHAVSRQDTPEPVCNKQRGTPFGQRNKLLVYLGFAAGVEGGGGFVQD